MWSRIKDASKIRIELIILFFFYIYAVPFTFFPVHTGRVVELAIYLIVPLLLLRKKILISKEYMLAIKLLFAFFILEVTTIVITILLNVDADYAYLKYPIIKFFDLVLPSALLIIYLTERYSYDEIIINLLYMMSLQAIISIAMAISPLFFDFLMSIMNGSEYRQYIYERYHGFRGVGLSVTSMFDFAIIQALSLLIVLFLNPNHKIKIIYISLAVVLSLSSSVLGGRIGLVIISLVVAFFIIFYKNFKHHKKLLLILCVLLTMFVVIFVAVVGVESRIIQWAFEMFINVYKNGSLMTTSMKELSSSMYYSLPAEIFILGSGVTDISNSSLFPPTDSGYMRLVIFYGVFGSAVLYFSFVTVLGYWLMMEKHNKLNGNISFPLVFVAILFISQYKGPIMIGGIMTMKLMFVLMFLRVNLLGTRPIDD